MPWFNDRRYGHLFDGTIADHNRHRIGLTDWGVHDEDGENVVVWFPATYEVCGQCDGRGSYVHPDIDGHGISPDEFADDPEFEASYRSGAYDIPCEECSGRRVELVANFPAFSPNQAATWDRLWAEEEDHRRQRRDDAYVRWQESGCPTD